KNADADSLNTIMITSSQIGEGKTLTAVNLAAAIAGEIDHTVLLVDADLRNPTVHKYLGMEPGGGLSDYLKGGVKLGDVLIKTGIGKLVVLPAGNPPDNPSELLSSDRMKALVKELKDRYKDRYIIFDSSPLLVTADPISLAGYMDGVLLVVQSARTTPKAARKALSLLKGCRVLGSVFNNVPGYLAGHIYPYNYGKAYAAQERYPDATRGGGD
nr:polysaccharide biosynthesis tyrosine autokinase [Nitrospiraceae bacterium]